MAIEIQYFKEILLKAGVSFQVKKMWLSCSTSDAILTVHVSPNSCENKGILGIKESKIPSCPTHAVVISREICNKMHRAYFKPSARKQFT